MVFGCSRQKKMEWSGEEFGWLVGGLVGERWRSHWTFCIIRNAFLQQYRHIYQHGIADGSFLVECIYIYVTEHILMTDLLVGSFVEDGFLYEYSFVPGNVGNFWFTAPEKSHWVLCLADDLKKVFRATVRSTESSPLLFGADMVLRLTAAG